MRVIAEEIGNIFLVKRNIDRNIILRSVAATLLTGVLYFILENGTIFTITLQEFAYPLVATAIVVFVAEFKLVRKFLKEYFKLTLFIKYLTFYFLISIALMSTGHTTYAAFLAILFVVSGLQRVIIQKTRALFSAEISEFMEFIKLYGCVRAAFFCLSIVLLFEMIGPNLPMFWIFFCLPIILLFEIELFANLYPYCKKHKDIEETILIIRKIAQNKNIKINRLTSLSGASDNFTKQQLNKLVIANYITIENKHVKLKEEYQKIYDGKL